MHKRCTLPLFNPDWIARDLEAYPTPAERAAYRAGLSTASAICDKVGADLKAQNTKRGKLTLAGAALVEAAEACGDRIWHTRETIHVHKVTKSVHKGED